MACIPDTLPELDSILPYLAGFNGVGNARGLVRPLSRAILIFDGVNWIPADGSLAKPLVFPDLYKITGQDVPLLVAMTAGGQVVAYQQPTGNGKWQIQSEGGVIKWVASSVEALPSGIGLIGRDQNNVLYALGTVDAKGLYYADGSGTSILIPPGSVGATLQINAQGKPTFSGQISGSTSAGGGASTGLSGVNSHNTSTTAISVICPKITLSNGTDPDITATNVNVAVNTTADPGAGGIDVGTVTTGWNYLYIIGNAANSVAAVFSQDDSEPDFSNAADYTHFAFAGVFYYDTDHVRPYFQRGRRFYIQETIGANSFAVTNTLAAVTFATPLNSLIPPIAQSVSGTVGGLSTATATAVIQISPTSSTNAPGMDMRTLGGAKAQLVGLAAPARVFTTWCENFDSLLVVDPTAPQIFARTPQTVAALAHGAGKVGIAVGGFTI